MHTECSAGREVIKAALIGWSWEKCTACMQRTCCRRNLVSLTDMEGILFAEANVRS